MFRRPLVVVAPRAETKYVTRQVHEHRAPTDESVALLKEFEDAADKRRIETLHLVDNAFHGTIHVAELAFSGTIKARLIFDLNGHRITVEAETASFARSDAEQQKKLLLDLRDKAAERIAAEVLIELTRGQKFLR
jgi:hypothetical protein